MTQVKIRTLIKSLHFAHLPRIVVTATTKQIQSKRLYSSIVYCFIHVVNKESVSKRFIMP